MLEFLASEVARLWQKLVDLLGGGGVGPPPGDPK